MALKEGKHYFFNRLLEKRMNKTITQETIISFIYNELSTIESLEIQEAINADSQLKEEYETILTGFQQLQPIEIQTDQRSKNLILKYSKNVSSMEASL